MQFPSLHYLTTIGIIYQSISILVYTVLLKMQLCYVVTQSNQHRGHKDETFTSF